ncbi:cytochrome P450 [Abortiporus biennis]|nr:cytochrome P450 [Abortiporus biennis]
MSTPLVVGVAFVAILTWLVVRSSTKKPYPPGPKGYPIIGNLLDLNTDPWRLFANLADKYGEIFHLDVVGQHIVVLNSLEAATEVLDRHSSATSSRAPNIVLQEYMTNGTTIGFMPYNETWKKVRRISHDALTRVASVNYDNLRVRESIVLIDALLQDSSQWQEQLKKEFASITLSGFFGYPALTSFDDPAFVGIYDFVERVEKALTPGNYVVEFIPFLKYLPVSLAKWKGDLNVSHEKDYALFRQLRDNGVGFAEKSGRNSLAASLAADAQKMGLTIDDEVWLLALLFVGGTDTCSDMMQWFFFTMIAHPDVQRKAQEELDRVVGRSRTPTRADLDHLPYFTAVVRELLRYRSPAPIGMPHYSTEDSWYKGYLIPKNSIVTFNQWAITHDKEAFGEDAALFNPDRYFNGSVGSETLKETKGTGHHGFGFGKRACVGRYFAEDSLNLICAQILWSFNIEAKHKNEKGEPILPSPNELPPGFAGHPLPFEIQVNLRFPDARVVLDNLKESLPA